MKLQAKTSPEPTAIVFDDGVTRKIEAIGEIWRIDDEWWRDRIARRYVDVVLVGGKHLVLFENQVTGEWFAQEA